jgi:C-terminal processing protease CtpA/Prc
MIKYLAIILMFVGAKLDAQILFQETNLDFELSDVNTVPFGWEVPNNLAKNGYSIRTSIENPKQGKKCLELVRDISDTANGVYGSAMQSIDASRFRGKKVRFTAFAKAQLYGKGSNVELWMKEKLINGQDGFLFKLEDKPVVHYDWNLYSFEYDVSMTAERLNFGILLFEKGNAWLDDCKLEIVNTSENKIEPPKDLTYDELENLKIFAKAYGYLAFFHPSDGIEDANSENLLYNGIKNISNAKNDIEILDGLKKTFNPIAPSAIFSNNGQIAKYEKPKEATSNSAVAWLHNGIYNRSKNGFFSSQINNIYMPQKAREAAMYQLFDAKEVLGKTFIVNANIKVNPLGLDGNAQIWLRIDREDTNSSEKDIYATMKNVAIDSNWKVYSNSIKIPQDAKNIRVGLIFMGDGQANFDNIEYIIEDNGKQTIISNNGFEDYNLGNIGKGWKVPQSVEKAGYNISIVNSEHFEGQKSLQIKSDYSYYKKYPKLGEVYNTQIGKSLYLSFPLVLYTDEKESLPKSVKPNPYEKSYNFEANDRFARIGSVIHLWNLLKHFDKRNMSESTIDSLLSASILKASKDNTEEDFIVTMRTMLGPLNDAQARLWKISSEQFYSIPILWRNYGVRAIIHKVFDSTSGFRFADIITHINDIPLNDYTKEKILLTSGASAEFRRTQMMAEIKAGKKGSKIKITVRHAYGGPQEIMASRDSLFKNIAEYRPESVEIVDTGIVYIDLTRTKDKELKQVLTDISTDKTIKALMFDLRGNSMTSEFVLGYFIDSTIKTSNIGVLYYTKPDKKLISRVGQGGEIKKLNLKLPKNIVFLCDEKTSGYSESILSLIKDYKIGKVIGVASSGAAGESGSLILPGNFGLALSVTDSKNILGEIISTQSIMPDIEVPYLAEFFKFDRDMIYNNGLEYLKGLIKK